MIIHNPVITGSLQVNGSSVTSIEQLDNISGSVVTLTDASASLAAGKLNNTTDTLTGDLTVTGKITAQEFHTEFVSASIIYQSGSTQFGDSSDDTHKITGSLNVKGNTELDGTVTLTDLGYFIGSSTYGFRFNTAADDFNNVIFYDNGNSYFRGNVGIGTPNANQTLTVNGDFKALGLWTNTSSQTFWGNAFADTAYGFLTWDSGYAAIASKSGNELRLGANEVTNHLVIDTNGNVGIGEDAPQSELNIFHATDPEIKMTINTHGDAGVILADADGLKIYGKGSGDQIRLYTNTTEALRVNSSGVITIGAPSSIATAAKLQIGEALSAGSSAALQVNGFARIEHGLLIHWDSDNTQAGYIQYGGANGFAFTTEGAGNGNVGIGITTPGYKLDVQGTMLATGTTRLATSSDATVTIGDARNSQPASSDTKLILSGKNLEAGGTFYGDYGQILFNATANYTGSARKWLISNGYATNKFAIIRGGDSQVTPTLGAGGGVTNGTVPFVISDDGNVGIGETTPPTKLTVNGVIRINGTSSTDSQIDLPVSYGALRWYDGSTFKGGLGTKNWSTVGGSDDLTLYLVSGNFNISNTNTSIITTFDRANGRVGIKNSSPARTLDVNGPAKVQRYTRHLHYYGTTDSVANQYFHIKTSVSTTSQTCMHTWHVEGYSYGTSAVLDERFCFHTDSGGSIYNKSYKGSYANNIYASSDNYVVLVFGTLSVYYTHFHVNLFEGMYTPLNSTVLDVTYTSSNSGAY